MESYSEIEERIIVEERGSSEIELKRGAVFDVDGWHR